MVALVSLIVVLILLVATWRAIRRVRERFLWRVRRKLTLSYVFIGFVPILLIVVFFFLCGLLLFFNVSSYLAQSRVETIVEDTRSFAEATAIELGSARNDDEFDKVLTSRQ